MPVRVLYGIIVTDAIKRKPPNSDKVGGELPKRASKSKLSIGQTGQAVKEGIALKTIYEYEVYGVNIVFLRDGVLLSPDVDLSDWKTIKAYKAAQKIHPLLIKAVTKPDYYPNALMRDICHFSDDLRQMIIDVVDCCITQEIFKNENSRVGWVYLIHDKQGRYKIGKTGNHQERFRMFGVKLPFEFEHIALIFSDDMHRLEKELHRQFATKRLDGEWFQLDSIDIEYIKSLQGGV